MLYWFSSPWLTDDGTVLLTVGDRTAGSMLLEVDTTGATVMECALGLERRRQMWVGPVLASGRYVMLTTEGGDGYNPRFDAWTLPGYAPATRGWVSERGSWSRPFLRV